MYQLLPRPRLQPLIDRQNRPLDLDLYDVGVWLKNQWGVFSPESRKDLARLVPNAGNQFERLRHFVQAALVRARRFHHALDKKPLTPPPVDIYLFASKSSLTAAKARVYWRNDLALLDFEDADLYSPGDQTVTFASAIGDERKAGDERTWVESPIDFRAVFLMAGNHLEMTRSRSFTDNLLQLLLSTKPPSRRGKQPPAEQGIGDDEGKGPS